MFPLMGSNCLGFLFLFSFSLVFLLTLGILIRYPVLFVIQEMSVFSDISDSCREIRLIDKALNGAWREVALQIKTFITCGWRLDRTCRFLVTSWLSSRAKLNCFFYSDLILMALVYRRIKLDLLNLKAGFCIYHLIYIFEFEFIHAGKTIDLFSTMNTIYLHVRHFCQEDAVISRTSLSNMMYFYFFFPDYTCIQMLVESLIISIHV